MFAILVGARSSRRGVKPCGGCGPVRRKLMGEISLRMLAIMLVSDEKGADVSKEGVSKAEFGGERSQEAATYQTLPKGFPFDNLCSAPWKTRAGMPSTSLGWTPSRYMTALGSSRTMTQAASLGSQSGPLMRAPYTRWRYILVGNLRAVSRQSTKTYGGIPAEKHPAR